MTTEPEAPTVAVGRRRTVRTAPLWAHALAALALIGAFVLLSRPGLPFTSDEGAGVAQARILRESGGWLYRYPLDWLEPADGARPFVRGNPGSNGIAPYAKHPLYPVVILAAGGGMAGALVVSVLGTVVAAWLAALIAAQISSDRSAPVVVLWTTAFATPLLFDAGLALAHTIAAAGVAGISLCALRALDRRTRRAGWLAGAVALAVVSAMARTEAVVVILALACVVVVVVRTRWSLVVGATLAGGAGAAMLLDRLLLRVIVGVPQSTPANTLTEGLRGRWDGFYTTWLSSTYGPQRPAGAMLWLVLAVVAVAVVLLRRRRIRPASFALVAGAAALAYLARAVLDPAVVIPGLLLTVPVVWTMAWFVRPRSQSRSWQIAALTSVAGAAAILLTQYSIGGGVEWGGRYFALLLPLVVAVVVAGSIGGMRSLLPDPAVLRTVGAAALVATVALGATALATLRQGHERSEVLSERLADVIASDGSTDAERPIVLTSNRLLPQLLLGDLDRYRWVAASASELPAFADQLSAAGVGSAVLVAPDAQGIAETLPGWEIRSIDRSSAYDIVVIRSEAS